MYDYYKHEQKYYREERRSGTILMVEVSEDESHVIKGVMSPHSVPDDAEKVVNIPGCVRKEFGYEDRLS